METDMIEARINSMDRVIYPMTQKINELQNVIQEKLREGRQYEASAMSMENQAYSQEDDSAASEYRSRAAQYYRLASQCYQQADLAKSELRSVKGAIRGYRSSYEDLSSEASRNISNQSAALQKVNAALQGNFGSAGLTNAANVIQQAMQKNQALIGECNMRIQWIDQNCADDGSEPRKVLRR